MLSFKLGLYLLIASIFVFHLLPSPVICGDDEEELLKYINIYRTTLNLPALEDNGKADCLADDIAGHLGNKKCQDFGDYYPAPGSNSKIPNFQKSVDKCKIDANTTKDGVIMPLCVPGLDTDDWFSNYTKSNRYTKYLNSSKYKIAGVGSEENWMVLILSTNSSSGSFSSATSLLAEAWKSHFLAFIFFFSTILVLFN